VRRLGATLYEAFIVATLLVAVGFALLPFVGPAAAPPSGAEPARSLYALPPAGRALMTVAALAVPAAYCVALWSRGRRTLAMRTWRLALVSDSGQAVSGARALIRYLACLIGPALSIAAFAVLPPAVREACALVLLATNYVWSLIDPDRRFLQDRIAGTRLVRERP